MTAQLEAMAVAARLDLLAYFLGMARAESEIYVRTNAVAEAERPNERAFRDRDCLASREQFFRLSSGSAQISLTIARNATRSPEYSTRPATSSSSSATRTIRAEASAARASSSSVIGEGPSKATIRSRATSASSPAL